MPFPKDTRADLEAFYGKHVLGPNGQPTSAWQAANLKNFTAPYPLTLSFDLTKNVTKLFCHKLVGESLVSVFEQILEHYGSIDEVKKARMHLYGGCYNFRLIKNSNRLSTHSWGASIDIDPDKNPLGKAYDESAGMMPKPVIKIFEAEGWKWGGRFKKRPDCMHFQAAI
jgi:D-alanyl-D-alanine carboxypeptidase